MMSPDTRAPETPRERTVRELRELTAALDRRVPQLQRVGARSMARASADLRALAISRLEQLVRE